jgi:parallel beta-helix repeat protein
MPPDPAIQPKEDQSMIRILTCFFLASVGWLSVPALVKAAESYDNCTGFISSLPATISTQGTWCLNKDLSTIMTSGDAITIAANNVTLDCNHFKIGGLGAGMSTQANGIRAVYQRNVTVRNCNVRGFLRGVYITYYSGHVVENNRLEQNRLYGIWVWGSGSTIRNNFVVDTGGAQFEAAGIYSMTGGDILGNTINGVAPGETGGQTNAFGILAEWHRGSINGNRVRGVAGANHWLYGILVHSSRGMIRGNDVQGPGPGVASAIGIICNGAEATARENVIAGFETGISDCLASENVVNPN